MSEEAPVINPIQVSLPSREEQEKKRKRGIEYVLLDEGEQLLQEELEKRKKRAEKFGVAFEEPKVKDILMDHRELVTKRYRNPFASSAPPAAGIDLYSAEGEKKKDARAKRFGLSLAQQQQQEEKEKKQTTTTDNDKDGDDAGDAEPSIAKQEEEEDEKKKEDEEVAGPRHYPMSCDPVEDFGPDVDRVNSAVYIHGVDHMKTRQVFKYFDGLDVMELEWINGASCVVHFVDELAADRALHTVGDPVTDTSTIPIRTETSAEDKQNEAKEAEEEEEKKDTAGSADGDVDQEQKRKNVFDEGDGDNDGATQPEEQKSETPAEPETRAAVYSSFFQGKKTGADGFRILMRLATVRDRRGSERPRSAWWDRQLANRQSRVAWRGGRGRGTGFRGGPRGRGGSRRQGRGQRGGGGGGGGGGQSSSSSFSDGGRWQRGNGRRRGSSGQRKADGGSGRKRRRGDEEELDRFFQDTNDTAGGGGAAAGTTGKGDGQQQQEEPVEKKKKTSSSAAAEADTRAIVKVKRPTENNAAAATD